MCCIGFLSLGLAGRGFRAPPQPPNSGPTQDTGSLSGPAVLQYKKLSCPFG